MNSNTLQEYVQLFVTESVKNSVWAKKLSAERITAWDAVRHISYDNLVKRLANPNLSAVEIAQALYRFIDLEEKKNGYNKVDFNKLGEQTIQRLVKHPNQNVRQLLAYYADKNIQRRLIKDKASAVRIEVAKRVAIEDLPEMMNDKNRVVRNVVSKRIDNKYLPEMMNDTHGDVRVNVAARIEPSYLRQMLDNEVSGENHHTVISVISVIKDSLRRLRK